MIGRADRANEGLSHQLRGATPVSSSRIVPAIIGVLFVFSARDAAALPADDPWEPYQYLVGDWVGEGGGRPGQGTGRFSFHWDLQKHVLVRRNVAEFPAAQGRPASVHEDLMVIHHGDDGAMKAVYFDSEGHVIRYTIEVKDQGTLVFVSDPSPSAPRFRLSYAKGRADEVSIKFEMAPPGKPDGFRTYLEGKARRAERAAKEGSPR
jgi:hypothetical protein